VVALVVATALVVVIVSRQDDGGSGGDDAGSAESDSDGWVAPIGNAGRLASDGETVCGGALDGSLFCLDAATGTERFSIPLGDGVTAPPVLVDDRLIVAHASPQSGQLSAYTLDGDELWTAPLNVRAGDEIPVVDGVATVVDDDQMGADELVGIDVSDGSERWRLGPPDGSRFPDQHDMREDAYTDGTRVYVALISITARAEPSTVTLAVDPSTGAELWRSPLADRNEVGVSIEGVAPLDDGSVAVLVNGYPSRVLSLDPATGEKRWEEPLAASGLGTSLVHLDGSTIVLDGDELRAYDAAGDQQWRAPAPGAGLGSELVVQQDRLFLAAQDLSVVDPSTGEATLVREGVGATDVAITGNLLVCSGTFQVEALPLSSID
jgi:outer membrane protein assembly factor BamB